MRGSVSSSSSSCASTSSDSFSAAETLPRPSDAAVSSMRKNASGPNLLAAAAASPVHLNPSRRRPSPIFRRLRRAPLAYAEDDSSLAAMKELRDRDPPSLPQTLPSTPRSSSSATSTTNTTSSTTTSSGGNRFRRLRLPPPLRLVRKKASCPSLNNSLPNQTPEPAPPSPPPLNILRNPIHSLPSHTGEEEEGGKKSQTKRHFLLREGTVAVCRLHHPRTVLGKLSSNKLLRRWETHTLRLGTNAITSTTMTGVMEKPLEYIDMEDIVAMPNLEAAEKFCLRIGLPDGSLLIQTKALWSRREWEATLLWRREIQRSRRLLLASQRPEIILKESKCLVELGLESGIQDDAVFLEPVQIITALMQQVYAGGQSRSLLEPLIVCVAPLLEALSAVAEIAPILSRGKENVSPTERNELLQYCEENPRSRLIDEVISKIAHHALKKNMDFGKQPAVRWLVQHLVVALWGKNEGGERVDEWVAAAHGPVLSCPHPRVLPNLISAALAGVQAAFPPLTSGPLSHSLPPTPTGRSFNSTLPDTDRLACFVHLLHSIAKQEDWRLQLASILQPLPFPDAALEYAAFTRHLGPTLALLASDPRCEFCFHPTLPRPRCRNGKRQCIGNEYRYTLRSCHFEKAKKDGLAYFVPDKVETLLGCCCRRKRFLRGLVEMLGPLQLLALREKVPAMEAISLMLELEVVENGELAVQITTALTSTSKGKAIYAALCDRQDALRNLQEAGGPRKLSLPSRSTDGDLAVLLSSGSFGNLEWLSLAFTNVTSRCAEYLIRLPSLRYLNLWSTQFGDAGLIHISEHLTRLQVLNLCETPTTDKGLLQLASLKNLRKLNLNSTQLSINTFQYLREQLPVLQEVDIRYTEAWCAER